MKLTSLIATLSTLLVFVSVALPQKNSAAKRDLQNSGSYAISDFETINLSGGGNVSLKFPLATLPKGRGTAPGHQFTLLYDSRIWKSEQKWEDDGREIDGSFEDVPYTRSLLKPSQEGGWRVATKYEVQIEDRLENGNREKCKAGNDANYSKNSYRWKLVVRTPGGTSIPFRPIGYDDAHHDGYFEVHPSGLRKKSRYRINIENRPNCLDEDLPRLTSGLHYYSTDGSSVRLFFPSDDPERWTMRFPNGTTVKNNPDSGVVQRISDLNGNNVTLSNSSFQGKQGLKVADDLGRFIFFDGTSAYQFGVGGEVLETKLSWKSVAVFRRYRTALTSDVIIPGEKLFEDTFEIFSMIESIKLPDQVASEPMKYRFEYHGDESSGERPAVYTDGWGEIASVTTPTGATSRYYHEFPEAAHLESAADVVRNKITKKELEYTTSYDLRSVTKKAVWNYEIGHSRSIIFGPDGSRTEQMHYGFSPYSDDFYADWRSGLVHSEIKPDGTAISKEWKHKNGNSPIQTSPVDTFVSKETTTKRDELGRVIQSKREIDYDKNQNILEVRFYGFALGDSDNSPLLRRVVNTYYNPTSGDEYQTVEPNDYRNPGAPALLRLLKTSETTSADGEIVSRSEFLYDNQLNPTKGNLTEIRRWSSTKGDLPRNEDGNGFKLSSSNAIITKNEYDQYGNEIASLDENGVRSEVSFEQVNGFEGLYPTKSVSAINTSVSKTSAFEYDFETGLETLSTDVDNQVSTISEYDALGRITKIIDAVGTPSESHTVKIHDESRQLVITKTDLETAGDGLAVSVSHFDPLGKIRLERVLENATTEDPFDERSGIKTQTRYRYDFPSNPSESDGVYSIESSPYRAPTSAEAGSEETMGWTRRFVSADSKTMMSVRFPGAEPPAPFGNNNSHSGIHVVKAHGNSTLTTDASGREKRMVFDSLGRLIRVDEANDNGKVGGFETPNQSTNYQVSTNGKLLSVSQGAQTRSYLYDSLGRMIRVQQPEQEANPSISIQGIESSNQTWTTAYQYDDKGQTIESIDAANRSVTYDYDELGRITRRDYSDSSTPSVILEYDNENVSHSRGRLTSIDNGVSRQSVTEFDAKGRATKVSQNTDGVEYNTEFRFNTAGQLVSKKFPSGRVMNTEFDASGRIARVFGKQTADGAIRTYANGLGYSTTDQITRIRLGNGLWESARLDGNLQTKEIALGTSTNNPNLWSIKYEYGELKSDGSVDEIKNTGNVAKQTILGGADGSEFVQTYRYDGLQRLVAAREENDDTETWQQQFSYDRYGNRLSFTNLEFGIESDSNLETNPGIEDTSNRFAPGQGFQYDELGNLVSEVTANGTRHTKFDGNNKQIEVRDEVNRPIARYFYDGTGKRVKRKRFDSNGELLQTTTFVYAGGELIAEYEAPMGLQQNSPKTKYVAEDISSSVRVITDQSGKVISRRDFKPFGERIESDPIHRRLENGYVSDDVSQGFTGHQHDTETGLDFAEARMYDSKRGRFTAVDPLLASGLSTDPQTFNRYAYVSNSPLLYTDPDGLQANRKVVVPNKIHKEANETTATITRGEGRSAKSGTIYLSKSLIKTKRQLTLLVYTRQTIIATTNRANTAFGTVNPKTETQTTSTESSQTKTKTESTEVGVDVSKDPRASVKEKGSKSKSSTKKEGDQKVVSGPSTSTKEEVKKLAAEVNIIITNYLNTEENESGLKFMVDWGDGDGPKEETVHRETIREFLEEVVKHTKGHASCDAASNACVPNKPEEKLETNNE